MMGSGCRTETRLRQVNPAWECDGGVCGTAPTPAFLLRRGRQNHAVRIPSAPMHLPWLNPGDPFPPSERAWDEKQPAPGLLAAGGALDVDSLRRAYSGGIFPWFSEGQPILWWSTDPRMVLFTDELHISHNLAKKLRRVERERGQPGALEVHFDRDFEAVMRACAEIRPGSGGTWISEDIISG